MRIKAFIKKEIKSQNRSKIVLLIALLSIMVAVTFIGNINKIELRLGLNIDGLVPLLKALLNDNKGIQEISIVVVNIGFVLSLIVFTVYVGLPYAFESYQRSKVDGTLMHLMIMPIDISILVFKFALFGFLQTLFMTLCSFIILLLPLVLFNPSILLSLPLVMPILILLNILFLITISISLLWIFNGNKIVMNIYRWLVLLVLVALYPMVRIADFTYVIPIKTMLIMISILLVVALICLFLVRIYFNKEKVTLLCSTS